MVDRTSVALDVLEALIEAAYTKERAQLPGGQNRMARRKGLLQPPAILPTRKPQANYLRWSAA
jgi:hypothetical protein